MKKLLILSFIGLGLFACGKNDKFEKPIDVVKYATLNDTYDFCMRVNKNKEYCDCEINDLDATFPWADYINVVDVLANDENHIAHVIEKYNGDRDKILSELNCDTCYFAVALGAIDVSPSPKCVEILSKK